MNKLAIIGTAGRKEDASGISISKWKDMKRIAAKMIQEHKIQSLISGGAAISDHICVQAFNSGFVKDLTLCLPCAFNVETATFNDSFYGPGAITNLYHRRAHINLEFDGLKEIATAIRNGARVLYADGFFARNEVIARECDMILAFTFGSGAQLKPGGTAHTMRKFLSRQAPEKSYHCDLNDMTVYSPASVMN